MEKTRKLFYVGDNTFKRKEKQEKRKWDLEKIDNSNERT